MIPYTLIDNDARYLFPNSPASGDDFFKLLRDAFDLLWQEGKWCPKMMSVWLHGRISGHPARALALARLLDYVQSRDRAWICRREAITRHWMAKYPAQSDNAEIPIISVRFFYWKLYTEFPSLRY